MVIPFNELPFSLEFSTGEKYIIKSDVVKFTDEVNDLNNRDYTSNLSIRENNNFFIRKLSCSGGKVRNQHNQGSKYYTYTYSA